MTINVSTVQRSVIKLDKDSTVLDLIRALTENLGGEWDDAHLEFGGVELGGGFAIVAVLSDGEVEPTHAERWESEGGKHVAVDAGDGIRTCSCEFTGTDTQMERHLMFEWT